MTVSMQPDRIPSQTDKLEKPKRYLYITATVLIAVVLFVCAIKALGTVGDALLTLAITLFIVFILRKPVRWFEGRRISRTWGSALAIIILVAILVGIFMIFVPPLLTQLNAFIQHLPSYTQQVIGWGNEIASNYGDLSDSPQAQQWLSSVLSSLTNWASSSVGDTAQYLIRFGTRMSEVLVITFLAFIAAFWFLRDLPKMTEEVNSLVTERHATDFHAVVSICSRIGDGYLKGLLFTAVCSGVLSSIGFLLVGVPYAILLGMLTGLLSIIPVIGPWIAGIAAAVVALFVSPVTCLLSIIVTVVVRLLTDSVIQPKIMSSTVSLHPGIVIIAIIAGGCLGGAIGMILAVPVVAMLVNVYAYFHEKRTSVALMSEDGALFKGTPFGFVSAGEGQAAPSAGRDESAQDVGAPDSGDAGTPRG
jgi:predicted PurR-regulated permease PerM